MDAVINLRREPKLREELAHAPVHNNTVLIDRRTKWGNRFRIGRDGTPELRYREGSAVRHLPGLVAAVTGDDGALQGVHRTWLDPRRPVKADVASPRKALGRIYGLAVRFGAHADSVAPLLVGEGIETVLSLVTAVPDITAAAALSAGSLGSFSIPSGCSGLVIARDNDPEGERAAQRLARRCARAGVAATVIVPDGGDFNDDVVALGADVLAARFGPLFRFAGVGEEGA